MKNKILIIICVICAICGTALADLTAIVLPGITLAPGVPLTLQNLNLLGEPTVMIVGTIGGSNTLAPGSVTTLAFSSSVYDNITIGLNSASPPGLQTLGAGIAGWGLVPTNTTSLNLYPDPNFLILSTNSLGVTNYVNAATGATNTTGNTGSAAVWLTLRTNSLSDINLLPGGISTTSINTNGLNVNRLAMGLVLTNIFAGEGVTNTTTNFNTLIYGNTNELEELVLLSAPNFTLTNQAVIATNIVGTTTNTWTNYPPTLLLTPVSSPALARVRATFNAAANSLTLLFTNIAATGINSWTVTSRNSGFWFITNTITLSTPASNTNLYWFTTSSESFGSGWTLVTTNALNGIIYLINANTYEGNVSLSTVLDVTIGQ